MRLSKRISFNIACALFLAISMGCHRAGKSLVTGTARIPRDAARFEIESVDDSTALFRPFEASWIRPGMTVYAVDPAQRDALVAQLRVVRADSGRFRAVVVSQVTRVKTEHFLLAVRPGVPWYRRRMFWTGALTGGAVGVILAR